MNELELEGDKLVANMWTPATYVVLDPQGRWDSWMSWRPFYEFEFWRMHFANHWN